MKGEELHARLDTSLEYFAQSCLIGINSLCPKQSNILEKKKNATREPEEKDIEIFWWLMCIKL